MSEFKVVHPPNIGETLEALAMLKVFDKGKYTDIRSKFNGQKSAEEMFACVWDVEENVQCWEPSLVASGKTENEANRLRIEGNHYYGQRNFVKSLEFYNYSIMASPHPLLSDEVPTYLETSNKGDCFAFPYINPARYGGNAKGESKALAKGFANRSAILFELELYEKCIRDIDLALEYGYPEELRAKLENRKQRCLVSQLLHDDGPSNIEKTAKQEFCVTDPSEMDDYVKSLIDNVLNMSLSCLQPNISIPLKELIMLSPKKLPVLDECNQAAPSLSNSVKVSCIPSKGRGLIAVRYIRPGEVLAVERAYSVSIDANNLATYCSNCLNFCLTPLPCPGCSQVIFCSKACRQRYLSEEHWIECRILPSLIHWKMPSSNYPYKLLKTFTHSQLDKILNQLQNNICDNPEKLGCDKKGVYTSTSYQAVHHLLSNKERFSPEYLLKQSQYAYIFTKLLKQSGRYFVSNNGEPVPPTRDDLVKTGAVMLSHILKMHVNQHMVSTRRNAGSAKRIAGGLFLSASLVNHSCYHSISRYTCGRKLVIRARRPIQPGEEITDTYTNGFSLVPLQERKTRLRNYSINCTCVACKCNWPIYNNLPKFKCFACKVGDSDSVDVCLNCASKSFFASKSRKAARDCEKWGCISDQLEKALDSVMPVDGKLKRGQFVTGEDLQTVSQCIELFHKYVPMPCQTHMFLETTLLGCFEAEL